MSKILHQPETTVHSNENYIVICQECQISGEEHRFIFTHTNAEILANMLEDELHHALNMMQLEGE